MTADLSRPSTGAVARFVRSVVTVLLATIPISGVVNIASSQIASADGPAIVLPSSGIVEFTTYVGEVDDPANVFVAQPLPQTTLCTDCNTSQSQTPVSIGFQQAGTTIVLGVYDTVTGTTYYSTGQGWVNGTPGVTVTQENPTEWEVTFDNIGDDDNGVPDMTVFVNEGPPNGLPPVPSSLYGSANAAMNLPFGCDADPVNCATGNYTQTTTDVHVPGRGGGLDLTRTYNSLAAADPSPFGYGWSSSYGMTLSTNATTGDVTISQENGSTVTFAPNGSGSYVAPVSHRSTTTTINWVRPVP